MMSTSGLPLEVDVSMLIMLDAVGISLKSSCSTGTETVGYILAAAQLNKQAAHWCNGFILQLLQITH